MSTYLKKRLMAFSGLFWLIYLIIHMFANLNFLTGMDNFNGFYQWFHDTVILRWSIIGILIVSFLFHVYIAISRQLDANKKRDVAYKKSYPKAVPRLIAWSGASMLFGFIVFHFVQMQLLSNHDFYQQISDILTDPLMLIVYVMGFIALFAHLYHALSNVAQTFGLTSKSYHALVLLFLLILIGGFSTVPISLYL